jgi:hypothetical protein
MQRIRAIHQEKMKMVKELRREQMYGYEATAPGHLVRIEWVKIEFCILEVETEAAGEPASFL